MRLITSLNGGDESADFVAEERKELKITFPNGSGNDFSLEISVRGALTVDEALLKINASLGVVVSGRNAREILRVIRAIDRRLTLQEEWGV